MSGYSNTGQLANISCESLRHNGQIAVQDSFFLDDDLVEVARSLEHHPMIDYNGQDKSLTFEQTVGKTWLRMAGSAVWFEKYQVFLSVTRVMFYNQGVRHWPVISFLRGQIYDENWIEKKNYTVDWQGQQITFPRIFDIPTPYTEGGGFYGPEDPRIIIEEGVEDAEPVIVFNMINDLKSVTRAMHIFRPFTNDSAVLTIAGEERAGTEKNWAPFFHSETTREVSASASRKRWPSQYLHFIHSFSPLKILKCHLLNGWCEVVYQQEELEVSSTQHGDTHGRMSGGTNLVSITLPNQPSIQAYIGFPRTHIDKDDDFCRDGAMYRPELMVMVAVGEQFHLDFMSEPLDFDTSAMDEAQRADPCGEGSIFIPNSVARWDHRTTARDTLTLTFSIADSTVQVMLLHGIRDLVMGLPLFSALRGHESGGEGQAPLSSDRSAVGHEVLACSIETGNVEEDTRPEDTNEEQRQDIDYITGAEVEGEKSVKGDDKELHLQEEVKKYVKEHFQEIMRDVVIESLKTTHDQDKGGGGRGSGSASASDAGDGTCQSVDKGTAS